MGSKVTPEQVFQAISNSIAELKAYIAADAEVARNVEQTRYDYFISISFPFSCILKLSLFFSIFRFASRFMAQLVHENRFAELITENLIKS